MTDHEKLLVAYFSDDTERDRGDVTMQEILNMLHESGARYRQRATELSVLATTLRRQESRPE